MRCAVTLAYNGTSYLGSQTQKESKNTIFGTFERALLEIGIESRVVASGRTDKGVHATGQVCHIDLPKFWSDLKKLKRVLNRALPKSIEIKKIVSIGADFHARYSARRRVYRYIIKNAKSNPFESDFITFLDEIDFKKVQERIKLFRGEHDFKSFMKSGSDTKSSIRVIYKAFAYKYRGYIILNFEANGFLRSQIRLMVAALVTLDTTEIQEQLKSQKNFNIKPAPANGLYLAKIKY